MNNFDQTTTHRKLNDGYKYYNYAILHSRGIRHIFDMMRYDCAFFARCSDIDNLTENTSGNKRVSILLAKYDWHGITKPHWTSERLCSDQEYELIKDPMALYELNSNMTSLRPFKELKIRTDVEVTAKLPEILQLMFANNAFPSDEVSARRIESEFSAESHHPFSVTLSNHQLTEAFWKV
jgi:hypothetical protein